MNAKDQALDSALTNLDVAITAVRKAVRERGRWQLGNDDAGAECRLDRLSDDLEQTKMLSGTLAQGRK